jgi:hypothetical protein
LPPNASIGRLWAEQRDAPAEARAFEKLREIERHHDRDDEIDERDEQQPALQERPTIRAEHAEAVDGRWTSIAASQ